MILEADAAQRIKRRRLNIVDEHKTQATRPSSPLTSTNLSPVGVFISPIHFPKREVCHDEGGDVGDVDNGACCSTSGGIAACQDRAGHEQLECCYGMLSDIPTKLSCGLNPHSRLIPVEFHSPNHLSSTFDHNPITFDIPCPISARTLSELENVDKVNTQLYCHSKLKTPFSGRVRENSRHRVKQSQSWFLNIIIFGVKDHEEKVGKYLLDRNMYLQDPIGCGRSVLYRNPHAFPLDTEEAVMTDSFDSEPGGLEIERLDAGPNLLAQLMEDVVSLPQTEAPVAVKTDLFPHQKQALTFMVCREEGWAFEDDARDVWSKRNDSCGRSSYKNNISGQCTYNAPPEFRGGVLADDMGLGKTLSMICLIAANQARPAPSLPSMTPRPFGSMTSAVVKTTLLIVPPALIQAWEKQFDMHLKPGKLKLHVYHGQNKESMEFLEQCDIVITTYHTVSAIWRKRIEHFEGEKSIFSMTWHRVVLDEAHTIQNPQSQLAQACYALHSTRRWAITGTPIQNKLTDFASIVKFLQVHPYSDRKTFENEIIKPWQNRRGTDAQGFLRLKTLVRAITISRTKAVVQLLPRVDETHRLNFTPGEREKYEAAKIQSRKLLEEAISSGNQGRKTFNALWLLNILRLICNHGLLTESSLERKEPQTPRGRFGSRFPCEIPDPLDEDILSGSASCLECGASLLEDILEGKVSVSSKTHLRTTRDQMICERCQSLPSSSQAAPFSFNNRDLPDVSETSSPATLVEESDVALTIASMSTKIKALVADLYKHNATEKSVVFSHWTNTLDLVQLMLNDKGIPYTRIDGKTTLRKRNEALRTFQCDDSVRVILVSITCGGAGLDLTAGSRAYLLEPHWNPMVEEQALCRVYRIGQKNSVTTIRYLIRDSFEEQIVEIQKRKKMLAQVTFTDGPLLNADIGLGTLQYLRSVLD